MITQLLFQTALSIFGNDMKKKIYLLCGLLCDATVWQHQAAALSHHFDVESIDFQGWDSLTKMAEHVLSRDPEEREFILAGHSMGARVALEVYRLAPQRVEKLILLDTGTHPLREGETEQRMALLDAVRKNGMPYLIQHWLMPMLAEAHRTQPEIVQPLTHMVLRFSVDDFTAQLQALIHRPDAASVLNQIRCPLLLGVGEHDRWSPISQHLAMQQAVPHAQFAVFPDAGHMAPFETPYSVNNILLKWLVPEIKAS